MPRTLTLNWMDWITLSIVLVSILRATRYGALAGLLDLVILVASFFAASMLYTRGAHELLRFLILPVPWAAFTSFVVIGGTLYISGGMLVRWVFAGDTRRVSRMLGGLLGGIRGLLLVTALLVLMLASPHHEALEADAARSRVAPYLLWAHDRLMTTLLPVVPVRIPRIGPGGQQF